MNVILGLPPLELMCDTNSLKFVLKCLTSNDIMTGLIYQIAETPAHPFYDHIRIVKQYLAYCSQVDGEDAEYRSVRRIDIGLIPQEKFQYTKSSIERFLCNTWDRCLQSDRSLFFQSSRMVIDTKSIREAPFIRRFEKRKNDVQYLDFLHGRSARFKDFRRTVGFTSSDICDNCQEQKDSVEHKLFRCTSLSSENRDNFVRPLGDIDYRSAILFYKDESIRTQFRRLVDTICENSDYDYREVLNR